MTNLPPGLTATLTARVKDLEDAAQSMWIIADQLNFFLKDIFENVPEVKANYAFNPEGDRRKIDAVEKLLEGTWSHESSADRVADLKAMVGELTGALECAKQYGYMAGVSSRVYDDRVEDMLAKARALVPEVEG